MDNDSKINHEILHLTHEATSLFIQDVVEKKDTSVNLYNMDEEFAKTKKNKNNIVKISLGLFTLLSISAAFFVSKYIEDRNSKIPISINAFEDVNLREIFDKAKQNDNEMMEAQRVLKDLYLSKDKAISNLNTKAEMDISIIEAESPVNKDLQISNIYSNLKLNIEQEEEFWNSKIEKAQTDIDKVQEKIDSYDTRILEKAKEQEVIINNQQVRFDLQIEELTKYYETKIEGLNKDHSEQMEEIITSNNNLVDRLVRKQDEKIDQLEGIYNPEINDEFSFLDQYIGDNSGYLSLWYENIDNILYKEGIITEEKVNMHITDFTTVQKVFQEFKSIPYYNMPKQGILYLEDKYQSAVKENANLISQVTPILKNKESLISSQKLELSKVNYFLTDYVKTNRVNGVVIDPRDDNIKIFIDPIYEITPGATGYIFRNDSDFIGTVELITNNGNLEAKIIELVNKNRRVKPFDKILLNLK